MINDLVSKVHSSDKYQKMVSDYLLSRDRDYMQSRCRLRLEKRYQWLKSSLEGAYSPSKNTGFAVNSWLPTLIFPMVREMKYMVRAMTKKNFRQDPLITLNPMYETPFGNAINAQIALNTNFKRTLFRAKCFDRIVDDVANFGCAISTSSIMRTQNNRLKTISTPFGPEQTRVSGQMRTNVVNIPVHILNYAQNPLISDPDDSDWKRTFESIPLSRLIAKYKSNPEFYLKSGIEFVIKSAKNEVFKDTDMWVDDKTSKDMANHGIDVKNFETKMWISGNEDDDRTYMVQMVQDKIISFQENTYDDTISTTNVYRMRRTTEYFWGNTPSEDIMPHEKFTHILMNMKAQNALQIMERYIFYMDDSIDPGELNNRHRNGGFVRVNQKQNLQIQNMIHEYQGRDTSTNEIDYLMREIKESRQSMAFKPDFLRSGNKGGLANNTATAATILDETGNLLEADCMEVFGYDVCNLGKINTILLQMFLGPVVQLKTSPKEMPVKIMKDNLLGDFEYDIVSTINKNKIQETIRLQNAITQILNYKGTADPSWQNVNFIPIAKEWIRQLDVGDPDNIIPEQQELQQQIIPGIMAPNQIPFQPAPQTQQATYA